MIEIQVAESDFSGLPSVEVIRRWVSQTFESIGRVPANITIRITDENEMRQLNSQYRNKNAPTNVLAFPFEPIPDLDYDHLGDIVICYPVVKAESIQQDRALQTHFAHMVIHGTLHLCGFDHKHDEEALIMEGLERDVLKQAGFEFHP